MAPLFIYKKSLYPFFNLKGIVHYFFLLSFKSHILDSNGVWYIWFWPEGSKNAQNSKFLGFNFVPRDLDSRRHMVPRLEAQGTSTRCAGDLDSRRHGTLTQIYGAASQGPIWRRKSRSLGTKLKTIFLFLAFLDPSGQNQLYHTPLLSKIWDLNDRKNLTIPFKIAWKELHLLHPDVRLHMLCIPCSIKLSLHSRTKKNSPKIWFLRF